MGTLAPEASVDEQLTVKTAVGVFHLQRIRNSMYDTACLLIIDSATEHKLLRTSKINICYNISPLHNI